MPRTSGLEKVRNDGSPDLFEAFYSRERYLVHNIIAHIVSSMIDIIREKTE